MGSGRAHKTQTVLPPLHITLHARIKPGERMEGVARSSEDIDRGRVVRSFGSEGSEIKLEARSQRQGCRHSAKRAVAVPIAVFWLHGAVEHRAESSRYRGQREVNNRQQSREQMKVSANFSRPNHR